MKYAILFIAIIVLAYLVMDFNSRTSELNRLISEKERVSEQLQYRQETQASLQTQIAYATSEAAVLDFGYQNHLGRSGDVVVVPVGEAAATPTPVLRPVVTPTQMNNLERWLSLFFDPPSQ